MVLNQLPLRSLLRKADYIGRVAKWGTILGAFNIKYIPRTSINGKVLANLVAEFTEPSLEENTQKPNMDGKSVSIISLMEPLSWKVYVDGAANQRGSRVELVMVSPEGITIKKSLRLYFSATNNGAKYEALLVGMVVVHKMRGRTVEIFSDSSLVVGQVKGELEARDVRMQDYLIKLGTCNRGLNPSPYNTSRGAKTRMLTLLPPLQPPRHRVYLGLSWLRICTSP
ncbi:uncharacterized protein LOC142632159 [Castanea sativa]|uniref:uncharacterized protein LOC142632159 n=1 Tax=Castanea sativa TaxID=21020 RepID=UPI003F64EEF2